MGKIIKYVFCIALFKDVLILKMHLCGEFGSSAELRTETAQHGSLCPSTKPYLLPMKSLPQWEDAECSCVWEAFPSCLIPALVQSQNVSGSVSVSWHDQQALNQLSEIEQYCATHSTDCALSHVAGHNEVHYTTV